MKVLVENTVSVSSFGFSIYTRKAIDDLCALLDSSKDTCNLLQSHIIPDMYFTYGANGRTLPDIFSPVITLVTVETEMLLFQTTHKKIYQ